MLSEHMVLAILNTLLERVNCCHAGGPSIDVTTIASMDPRLLGIQSITSLYCPKLIEITLQLAEKAVFLFYTTAVMDSLLKVWTTVMSFVERSTSALTPIGKHARREVLLSIFRILDAPVTSTASPASVPSHIFVSSLQAFKYLKMHLYWFLGEYAFLWGNNAATLSPCPYDSLVHEPIILRLIQAAWSEGQTVRSIAITALVKIATQAATRTTVPAMLSGASLVVGVPNPSSKALVDILNDELKDLGINMNTGAEQ